ncbi:Rho GTPase, putative [Entamoeba invadens IP1]|uniref:Rho GTPase, putative n=1 Tax=Entamoeba invadens IP1 TaxID=370355 RepID=A0A0A1UF64_ENTIV|nr:Rho GTPase, putative [Entamoeba invadens IP1]ELP95230.1 Rho GTPase, putative [Entamoeba invadens IP1]|eukprot:XP_004262001.1 Rho GTPase, putative [Entamoeba invadens IP1]
MSTEEKPLQVVIIGEGSVGKSSLCLMFVKGEFNIEYNPTIEETYPTEVNVDGKVVKMSIVDTAGQEEYVSLRDQFYVKGDAFILVYSIDNLNSFHSLNIHYETIAGLRKGKKMAVVLVGNKCDLEAQRAIQKSDLQQLSEKFNNAPYYETSAQNNINVKEVFETIARETLKNAAEEAATQTKTIQSNHPSQVTESERGGCCYIL